jgi:hypothetical protein
VRGADHRIAWIDWALEPVRDRLTRSDYDDLVSSLVLVIAGETFIVLLDVRGLSVNRARMSRCGRRARSSRPRWRPPELGREREGGPETRHACVGTTHA